MKKIDRYDIAHNLSKRFLKKNFQDLPTPLRILMYGEIIAIIDKAQYLKGKYGFKKLETIWANNRKVGSKSKDFNEEIG